MPPLKTIRVELPTGVSCELTYPERHDEVIVEVIVRALLGTLVGLGIETDADLSRAFLVKYTGALINMSEMTIKRMLVAEKLEPAAMSHIVDEFLRSLNKDK